MTDDRRGLHRSIDVLPLHERGLPERPQTEAWRKLQLFDADNGLTGTCLFLDLDIVITSSLDPFFSHDGEFCIIKNWTHDDRRVGNSSVMRFVAGQHAHIFEKFARNPDHFANYFRNEQIFLSDEMDREGQVSWWPKDWCKSYKKHCVQRGVVRLFKEPVIPSQCRIVVFHGQPNPPDAAGGWIYRTEKKFRIPKFAKPASWITNYWR